MRCWRGTLYKRLIALSKETPSLHSRYWQPLEVEPSQQLYGYVRYVEPNDQPVLVLLNFSDQELEAEVPLPEEFAALLQQDTLRDVLVDETVPVKRSEVLGVPMPAWGARVLLAEG